MKRTASNKGIAIIKKSNQLIEARYKFDVWETRFFLAVLSQIRKDDNDLEVYRIWYRDVVKTFGLKSNQSYELLRSAAKSLMDKSFYINYEKDGTLREVQYHILRKIDYLKNPGADGKNTETQEYIDVTVEQEMKPLLLQLQRNFTAYDLRNVRKLGAYPVRVYELLKQYESIGERTIYIDEMKRMFELTTEYPRFPNFFQKIVQPAIRDINLHTDLNIVDLAYVKEGKKVVALRFVFRKKDEEQLARARGEVAQPKTIEIPLSPKMVPTPPPHPSHQTPPDSVAETPGRQEKDRLFLQFQGKVVGEFGVSPSVFLHELEGVNETQVSRAVRVTERARREGRVKNPSGFFIEALRKGFTDSKEEGARKLGEETARKAETARLHAEIETLQDELGTRVNDKIRELTGLYPTLTDDAIESLRENALVKTFIAQKEGSLKRPLELDDFRKDRTLREWVKNKIVELRRTDFEPFLGEHLEKIAFLENQVKALS